MESSKRKSNVLWVIVALLLSLLAIATSVRSAVLIEDTDIIAEAVLPINWIGFAFNLLAFVFAIIYLLAGYSKKEAVFFKLFTYSYGLSLLISIASSTTICRYYPVVSRFLPADLAISFGIVMLFAFAKNLGKKLSIGLSVINIALYLLFVAGISILLPGVMRGGNELNSVILYGMFRQLVLAIVLFFSVRSKYIDKEERGTL